MKMSLLVPGEDALNQRVYANCHHACLRKRSSKSDPSTASSRDIERASNSYGQDMRWETPYVLFDLILCRYVAFTYFAEPVQRQVLLRLVDRLAPHGYLAIGTHERLPNVEQVLQPLAGAPQIFRRARVAEH
jgi:CheR methyltransferase, SAM binding domain